MNRIGKLASVFACLVAVAAPIAAPADSINNYMVLQYLESSGTQAIDTGVKFGLYGRLSNNENYKTYAAYRVMYMEVKEGDEQVQTHRFVPCRRIADGELGVYDTVDKRFLHDTGRAARGADAFLAGPDVVDRPAGMVIIVR